MANPLKKIFEPDKFIDELLEVTIWLWTPFYALYHLTREIITGENTGLFGPKNKDEK